MNFCASPDSPIPYILLFLIMQKISQKYNLFQTLYNLPWKFNTKLHRKWPIVDYKWAPVFRNGNLDRYRLNVTLTIA